MADHAAQLASGASQLGIDLQPQQSDKLLAYLGLLNKWNKAYNLTAVREPDEMVSRHLLDSLSILPFVHARGDSSHHVPRPAVQFARQQWQKNALSHPG